MPFRDAAATLAAAVESIRSQSLERWELLCVDDGSRDESADLADRLARGDGRIRILRLPRVGISVALNHAIGEAQGELVARMDADDVSLPRRLEIQSARLEADESLAAVGGAYVSVDALGREWKTHHPPSDPAVVARALERSNCLCHPAMLIRRTALDRFPGPYRGQFQLAEDYDLWLRMVEWCRIGNVTEVVLRYRRDLAALQPARVVMQALSAHAARYAARVRRAGRPDPAEDWDMVDRESLIHQGYTPVQIAWLARRALLAEARVARRHGFHDAVCRLLRHAAELSPRGDGLALRLDYAWRTARVLLS